MKSAAVAGIQMSFLDEGEGPALLLVHGFPLDHQMWLGQIEHFSRSRRVIAPDLRGFGKSASTDERVTMQRYSEDLAALLDAIDIDRVDFCGLSMGGYIGWQFLTNCRQRVRRAILCDTRAAADSPAACDGRLQMADRLLSEGNDFVADALLPKIFAVANVEKNAACVVDTRNVIESTAALAIAAAQRGMAERPDMTSRLAEIDVPTLLVCGEFDELTPPTEMRGIAAAMPQASFQEIAGAGHMAPLEQPLAVNQAMAEFLQ